MLVILIVLQSHVILQSAQGQVEYIPTEPFRTDPYSLWMA